MTSGRQRGLSRTGILITIGFVVCIVVGALSAFVLNTIFGSIGGGSSSETSFEVPEDEHAVTFYMNAEGYGEGCTRIPVQITGTDAQGNKVDKTIYLAYSGADTSLPAGDYEARVVGSPITPDGTIFSFDQKPAVFSIDESLGKGEAYTVDESKFFMLSPIPASDVTDEQIRAAVEWARKDEGLDEDVDIDDLERAARSRRDTADVIEGDPVAA